jgi:predicted enzyme related to lactoylglutathione lyase
VEVNRFRWYQLLTTDVDAAARFYGALLGWRVEAGQILRADGAVVGELGPLPERARAAGAPAHWRGHVQVADLDAALATWMSHGGAPLGPQRRSEAGVVAPVRDATGAVLCLSSVTSVQAADDAVAWHQLNTDDRERALAGYAATFGWHPVDALDLGPPVGLYQMFAYAGASRPAGAMANTARTPGVHNAWLYYFDVDDLDARVDEARTQGALVLGPMDVPGGDRVAVCDDPQGSAFGLRQRPFR